MKQLKINLRFITPCLGRIRGTDMDRFDRDTKGNVIFMTSWWRQLLKFGADAQNILQSQIDNVCIHPRIEGDVKLFKRYYQETKYTTHEAFLAGDIITITVLLPPSMHEKDFLTVLKTAGEFKGISPACWKDGYGLFEIVNEDD